MSENLVIFIVFILCILCITQTGVCRPTRTVHTFPTAAWPQWRSDINIIRWKHLIMLFKKSFVLNPTALREDWVGAKCIESSRLWLFLQHLCVVTTQKISNLPLVVALFIVLSYSHFSLTHSSRNTRNPNPHMQGGWHAHFPGILLKVILFVGLYLESLQYLSFTEMIVDRREEICVTTDACPAHVHTYFP